MIGWNGSHGRGWDYRVQRGGIAPGARPAARAFTLIELLVVIGIIAILISLTLAVGSKVTASGKARLTENALKILDTAADAFSATQDNLPPLVAEYLKPGGDPKKPGDWIFQPVADARIGQTTEMINSVGWFMYQCEKVPQVAPTFQKLDPKLMKKYMPGTQIELATVFDGWGNPIRYVHPGFDGLIHGPDYADGKVTLAGAADPVNLDVNGLNPLQLPGPQNKYVITSIRRNSTVVSEAETPDSDGGVCTGNKPYFYSAGPDGKVGYLVDNAGKVLDDYNADNIYLTIPTFQRAQ